MIVYPSAGIPAAQLDQPLINARIFWRSLTLNALAASVSVSSESASGPKDAPLRPDTVEYWEPTALPATWTFTIGSAGSPSAEVIDYVAIAGHTLGSSHATVLCETTDGTLAGSPSAEVWTTLAQSHAPADDSPIVFSAAPRTATKFRLTISGSTIPRLAVIYAGRSTAMQEPIRGGGHAPMTLKRQTVLHQSLSRGGQFLGQGIRRIGFTGAAAFELLDPAWYRANFDPFVVHARQYPYFFAWRPGQYADEVVFAWTAEDIAPQYMGIRDLMQVSWNMSGLGNG